MWYFDLRALLHLFHFIQISIPLITYHFFPYGWDYWVCSSGRTCVTSQPIRVVWPRPPRVRHSSVVEHPTDTRKIIGSTPAGRTRSLFLSNISTWLSASSYIPFNPIGYSTYHLCSNLLSVLEILVKHALSFLFKSKTQTEQNIFTWLVKVEFIYVRVIIYSLP